MQQYSLRLTRVTGLLLAAQTSSRTYTGSKEQLAEEYKRAQLHNVMFGWWGLIAIIWNVLGLFRNLRAKRLLDQL